MFHDDSTVEGREGIEQIIPPQMTMGLARTHCITFVDNSTVEIVAVGEVPESNVNEGRSRLWGLRYFR